MMSLAAYIDNALHSLFEGAGRGAAADDLVKAADQARDRKDWPQAAIRYAAAISSDSTRAGLQVQLGHALKELGDFDGAERMYRAFLQDNPDDADIHLQLGHLFNKKGDVAAALTFYEKAQQLAPQHAEIALHADTVRRNIGRIEIVRRRDTALALVAARKWEEARLLLRSLVAVDGENDLIGILANVTKEAGRVDEAEALYGCYLRYAEKTGNSILIADCHMQLGHLHKITGQYSVALTHLLNARKVRRVNGEHDPEGCEVEREIVFCLREIYPCFVFQA